jgi:hypothetical protein
MLIATNFLKLLKLSILTVRAVETLGPLRRFGQRVIPRSGLNGHRGISGPMEKTPLSSSVTLSRCHAVTWA